MDLNERYKALRGKTEQSMGRLAVVQQAMNERAAAGVDGGVVPTADGVVPVADGGDDQQWPPPPPGLPPQAHGQVHGQARQAKAVRNQIPIVHQLAAPAAAATATAALRPGNPLPIPPAAAATTTAPARAANPFTFTAPNYRQPTPQATQVHQVQQQEQYPGPSYGPGPTCPYGPGQGFGYQPNAPYGTAQFLSPYGGMWNQPQQQQQGDGARQLIRVPAIPLPVQPDEVQAASSWVTNCWPILPGDRMQVIFSFSQSGEVLTIRAPRDGEDWMKLNQREDDQRWGAINAAMAVLAASKTTPDRMMLEQYKALVQPTQFIELLRKTMPMTEAQLDMFTTMHDSMFRRLNALEMLYKGGQRAVDEFTASGLHGLEKRKANALQKAKRANPNDGGGGGGSNGNPARPRAQRAGGGYAGFSGNPTPSSTQTPGQAFSAPRQQQQQPQGLKCGKCHKMGHRTEDCRSG
jgi:hypothetical protein